MGTDLLTFRAQEPLLEDLKVRMARPSELEINYRYRKTHGEDTLKDQRFLSINPPLHFHFSATVNIKILLFPSTLA